MKNTAILSLSYLFLALFLNGCTLWPKTSQEPQLTPDPTPFSKIETEESRLFADMDYTHAGFLKDSSGKTYGTVMTVTKNNDSFLQAVIDKSENNFLDAKDETQLVGWLTDDLGTVISIPTTQIDNFGNTIFLLKSQKDLTSFKTFLVTKESTASELLKPSDDILLKATIAEI